jgi:recombination protein RecA
MLGDSVFSADRPFIKSGIPPVDAIVGNGKGFPTGIIEIYGPESSGKTALVEKLVASAQKQGWYVAFFASEYSLNYKRCMSVGIDKDKLIMLDAETIEDFFDQVKDTVKEIRKSDTNTPILVSWDSIASTPTGSEQEDKKEKGMRASDMGKFAQQMSKFFRRMARFMFKNRVCLLAVNQTRTNLGQMFGNPEVTPGGKALRFYAWVRCRLARIETIKDKDKNSIGYMIELKTTKNKTDAHPDQRCKFPIYWTHGIDAAMSTWEYCVDQGIFKIEGKHHKYHGAVVTRNTFPKYFERHRKELEKRILRAA